MAVLRSIYEGFGILYFDTKTCIFCVQSSDVPEQRQSTEQVPSFQASHVLPEVDGNALGEKEADLEQARREIRGLRQMNATLELRPRYNMQHVVDEKEAMLEQERRDQELAMRLAKAEARRFMRLDPGLFAGQRHLPSAVFFEVLEKAMEDTAKLVVQVEADSADAANPAAVPTKSAL